MENVADALKMAADVLVFIMALGISISSFSQARQTAQILVESNDREYSETQYVEDIGVEHTDRIVGAESIIPTIWRSYNEKIRIVFYDNDAGTIPMELYTLRGENNVYETVNYIDLAKQTIAPDLRNNFIMALLYGKNATLTDENGGTINYEEYKDRLEKNQSSYKLLDSLQNGGLYAKIKGKTFRETIGVYYLQDLEDTSSDDTNIDVDDTTQSNVPDANKTKLRVISYYQQ